MQRNQTAAGLAGGWARSSGQAGSTWMVIMDIVAWLCALGLERYASAFRDNDIDAAILPTLTAGRSQAVEWAGHGGC